MVLTDFRAGVVLRVALLLALCVALAVCLATTRWVATPLACAALLVLATVELISHQERTARDVGTFLNFVAHHDYSVPASRPLQGRTFGALHEAYRVLAGEFQRLNRQKAANLQYLEAVIEHVSVALCCFDEEGLVRLCNPPARQLFGAAHLHSRQSLARLDERLPGIVAALRGGERTLLSVRRGEERLQLLLHATEFGLLDQRYQLISFQNIRDELDRQELDSWQKLIRVLTHEIMNSVTPITSLASLVRETLMDDSGAAPALRSLPPAQQADMLRSITAIGSRSSALLDFVRAYRSFAALPPAVPTQVEAGALLSRVRTLMSREIEAQGVSVTLECLTQPLWLQADPGQVEQVLINLVGNALDALGSQPGGVIVLSATDSPDGTIVLQVRDNGCGIAPEHLDSIFVPFFTTKRNGTGVGLAVCRQLLQLNRALIAVRSQPGAGTCFTLRFLAPPLPPLPLFSGAGSGSVTARVHRRQPPQPIDWPGAPVVPTRAIGFSRDRQ